MTLTRSPFQFTGNKKKALGNGLLDILIASDMPNLADMMTGSGVIALNWKGEKFMNDANHVITRLHQYIRVSSVDDIRDDIASYTDKYDLTWQPDYYDLRDLYNKSRDEPLLLILLQVGFNSLFRFNKSGEFNVPFGHNKKTFSLDRIIEAKYHYGECTIFSSDIFNFHYSGYEDDCVFYFDPPYHFTKYQYDGWTIETEHKFWDLMERLDSQGFKIAISNVLRYRGEPNEVLIDRLKVNQFQVTTLDNVQYNNWQKAVSSVEHTGKTVEVVITNYTGQKLSPF